MTQGFAISKSAFTYARGRLVLYSRDAGLVRDRRSDQGPLFQDRHCQSFDRPYGAAALDVMRKLGIADRLKAKLVRGNNVAQAYQFVRTGNAELGFVALGQIQKLKGGSRWIVPAAMHAPILQDAVLLTHGANNAAAKAFLKF